MMPFKHTLAGILLLASLTYGRLPAAGGGLLTHTGQSAQYARMLSRNASIQTDAAYYNPAGLVRLKEGWFFSAANHSGLQTTDITSHFPLLNESRYSGRSEVILSPTLHAIFRTGAWAFTLSYLQVTHPLDEVYDRGIPSLEIGVVKSIAAAAPDYTGYAAGITLHSRSADRGFQLGAAYAPGPTFSVYGGIRYVRAGKKLDLAIQDVQVQEDGSLVPAAALFLSRGNSLRTTALEAALIAAGLQETYIAAGAGQYDLATLTAEGIMPAAEKERLVEGLRNLQITGVDDTWPVRQVKDEYDRIAQATYRQGSACLVAGDDLQDKITTVTQTGSGVVPVIGFMLAPSENMELSARYEYKTKMRLTNRTTADGTGFFADGEKTRRDIPALLALGLGYRFPRLLELQFSYNLFFDKGVSWGVNFRESYVHQRQQQRYIDDNLYELALGLQFSPPGPLAFSLGGLVTQPGTAPGFQSDWSFMAPSVTMAGGFQWNIGDRVTLDAGCHYRWHEEADRVIPDEELPVGKYGETYAKTNLGFALGLSLRLSE